MHISVLLINLIFKNIPSCPLIRTSPFIRQLRVGRYFSTLKPQVDIQRLLRKAFTFATFYPTNKGFERCKYSTFALLKDFAYKILGTPALRVPKGQLISKAIYSVLDYPKKRTKKI